MDRPSHLALLPAKLPFVRPKLAVKEGDATKIGSLVFVDKRDPRIQFLSPGGGTIDSIRFGPRRIIEEIVIALDPDEAFKPFPTFSKQQIADAEKDLLVQALMNGGVWPFLRQLPYRDIADPDFRPPMIIVGLESADPFQPEAELYLEKNRAHFEFGLEILRRLSETVLVAVSKNNSAVRNMLTDLITHTYSGAYPAEDPGVLLYHIKRSPTENHAWYIHGQDLLMVAQLMQSGRYPVDRIVAVGGNLVSSRYHVQTRLGVPIRSLHDRNPYPDKKIRPIVGGIFRGYRSDMDSFLGFYDKSVTFLCEGDYKEAFGFIRPGFQKTSRSRAFLSVLNKSNLHIDCRLNGEERACINCGSCASLCPVDILPQFTLKAIVAEEVEEYIAHGLLDCVDCGLCTFACPSKIELGKIFKKAKTDYYLEKV
jgi:Na+-transporting NADH:ubiquinone oxidoreductase subunit A